MQRKVPFMKVAESFGECVNVLDNGPLTDENFNFTQNFQSLIE